jgi:ribosomal protein S18 acetylase RimI-like enzyme
MTYTKNTSLFARILFIMLAVASSGAILWYYLGQAKESLYDYDPSLDRAFVIDLFKKDWYWLISDYSAKDYSVEYMLDHRASSKEHEGNLILKTYRLEGKPIGFVAYYLEELFTARLLFLSVDKAQRSKGYARKILRLAMDDLKKRGVRIIRMITRTDNIHAQKLYKSEGFKQFWTDGAYMQLEKEI